MIQPDILIRWAMLAAVGLLSVGVARDAHALEWLSEELAPYQYVENGHMRGVASAIVQEAYQSIDGDGAMTVRVLPWPRIYQLLLSDQPYAAFSVVRSKDRDKQFKWAGPLLTERVMLFENRAHRASPREEIKVAAAHSTVSIRRLTAFGFNNIEISPNLQQGLHKLMRGSVELWAAPEQVAYCLAERSSISASQLIVYQQLSEELVYIAFSQATDDAIVEQWQAAIDRLRENGKHKVIVAAHRANPRQYVCPRRTFQTPVMKQAIVQIIGLE